MKHPHVRREQHRPTNRDGLRAEIARLRRSGLTRRDTAAALGLPLSTVLEAIGARPPPATPHWPHRATDVHSLGVAVRHRASLGDPPNTIANELGIALPLVLEAIKR